LWATGQDQKAADLWRDLLGQLPSPQDPGTTEAWAVETFRAGHPDDGLAAVERLLALPDATTSTTGPALNRLQRAGLTSLLGDLHLQRGETGRAQALWAGIDASVVSEASRRSLALRTLLVATPEGVELARDVLAAGGGPGDLVARLAAARAAPAQPTAVREAVAYLWGRWQLFRGHPDEAAAALRGLQAAWPAGVLQAAWPAGALRREVDRLLAVHAARHGICPPAEVRAWWLAEVRDRCAWAQSKSGR
jgi:hypothetical protein